MRKILYILLLSLVASCPVASCKSSKIVTTHDTITVDRVVTNKVIVRDTVIITRDVVRNVVVHDSVSVKEDEHESTVRREYDELGRLRAEVFNLRQKAMLTEHSSSSDVSDSSSTQLSHGTGIDIVQDDSTALRQGSSYDLQETKRKDSPYPSIALACVLMGILLWVFYKSRNIK